MPSFTNDPTTQTDDIGYLAIALFPYALLLTGLTLFGVVAFAPLRNPQSADDISGAATAALAAGAGMASPSVLSRRRRPEDPEPPIDGPPSGAFPAQDPDQ